MLKIFNTLGGVTAFLLSTPSAVGAYQSTAESVLENYWSTETVKRLSSVSSLTSRSTFNDDVDRRILLLHKNSLNGSGSPEAAASEKGVSIAFDAFASSTPYYKRITCGVEICEVVLVIKDADPTGDIVKNSVLSLNKGLLSISNLYKTLSPSIVTEGPGSKGVSVLYYVQILK